MSLSKQQAAILRSHTREATRENNRLRKGVSRTHNRLLHRPRLNARLILCASHFLFDGSLNHSRAAYYNRSKTLIDQQRSLVMTLFRRDGRFRQLKGDVIEYAIDSVEFVRFIQGVTTTIVEHGRSFRRHWKRMVLRAFFDDEGNVYISRDGRDRRVRGYQYNVMILRLIQELLTEFQIHATISRSSHCVEIKSRSELIRFRKEIGFLPGIRLNPDRKNSIWKEPIEKRELLNRAIASFR